MISHFIQRMSLCCFIFMMIACNVHRGKSVSQEAQMNDTVIFTGCQERIGLKEGSVAEIRLEAISGTGYQWVMKDTASLLKSLNSDELEFIPSKNTENMPGQGGFQVLRFKALKKGNGEIFLEYKRPWEEKTEKSCRIIIQVD